MDKPVILIAFANESHSSSNYLRNLPKEAIELRKSLSIAEENGLCEFLIIYNATFDSIISVFQNPKYRNRIAIFHFGGHAGSFNLLLKNDKGDMALTNGEGLVPFLANQDSLQLVFLNGCHTQKIAHSLSTQGVPAVIGTSFSILDYVATDLSISFYRSLTLGLEIERAWKESVHKILAQEEDTSPSRFYHTDNIFREEIKLSEQPIINFPWSLSIGIGQEDVKYWNLPKAANNPLFGLPTIENSYDLPNEPYRYLQAYNKEWSRNFFGRGEYIQKLYHRIIGNQSSPIILLHGQSGVGKSSLLKAGIIPRLATKMVVRYTQRTKAYGLSKDLTTVLYDAYRQFLKEEKEAPYSLLEIWKKIETTTKKPFIVILDQLEETFTRPNLHKKDELQAFVTQISHLFNSPELRPEGKLILSYRKEFHPEIDSSLKKAGTPFESVFLKKLDKNGIEEIITGLTSSIAHRNKYQLQIEEGLPTLIASDLLKDLNSSIAPILQIILTKLWQSGKKENGRFFNITDYTRLQKQGILLEDFFNEQLASLRNQESKKSASDVDSGLVLDILNYHTTEFGTAESREMNDLEEKYKYQKEGIVNLVQNLKAHYLLSDSDANRSTLAHDTLAPIVQNAIKNSDKPGQRALRLLETKSQDFIQHPDVTFIEETDLLTVENGRLGMRSWSSDEINLIEKSRKKRAVLQARRKRSRFLMIAASCLIFLSLITVSILLKKSRQQARGNQLISEALSMEKSDPTVAFRLVQDAIILLPEEPIAIQTRHDIYSYNEFYETLLLHEHPVSAIALSPDETIIAAASGQQVLLWSTKSKEQIGVLAHNDEVTSVAFSPANGLLLTGAKDKKIRIWNSSGKEIHTFPHTGAIVNAVFSPNGEQILASDHSGQVILWNLSGESTVIVDDFGMDIEAVAFSITSDTLLTGNGNGEIQFWNQSGTLLQSIPAHKDRVLSLDWNKNNLGILSSSRDATASIWSNTGTFQTQLVGHEKRINSAKWLPKSQNILTASDDYNIKLWTMDGKPLKNFRGHTGFVNDIAVSASGNWFVSGSADSTLRIWKIASKVAKDIPLKNSSISSLSISKDGQLLLGGTKAKEENSSNDSNDFDLFDLEELEISSPQNAIIWNAAGEQIVTLKGHKGRINSVAISDNKKLFLTGAADGKAIIWDQQGNILDEYLHKDEVNSVAFSPNGDFILTGSSDSTAILWNIESKKAIKLVGHQDFVSAVAFSPNGQELLTGCYDNMVRVFNLKGQLTNTFEGHSSRVSCLACSADGKILSGGWDNKAILWSKNGKILHTYTVNSKNSTGGQAINSVAFSPKGDKIALGAEGGLIKIFSIDGKEIQTITTLEEGGANDILFTPIDNYFITGEGNKIRFWQLADQKIQMNY